MILFRKRRLELGLKAVDVARAAKLTRQHYWKIESGNIQKPINSTLQRICEVLKLDPKTLKPSKNNESNNILEDILWTLYNHRNCYIGHAECIEQIEKAIEPYDK